MFVDNCCLGRAATTQVLEAIKRAGGLDTAAPIKAPTGHEIDGCKTANSSGRASVRQHVRDVLGGKALARHWAWGTTRI